jgi:carotenoid 1,2-hydratase
VGLSWHRDGKLVAYALNAYRREAFAFSADPFAVEVAGSRVERRTDGSYRLRVDTPAVDGRTRIRSDLVFRPAAGTEPLERDLGHAGSPHLWILAAPDCAVSGTLERSGGRVRHAVEFVGRGYHDHNAGSEEIGLAMRRWSWGRFHVGDLAHVYYHAEPRAGAAQGVWITCRGGRPEVVREVPEFEGCGEPGGNVWGVRHDRTLRVSDGTHGFRDLRDRCLDDGPFYRRWQATFQPWGEAVSPGSVPADDASAGAPERSFPVGISELLDTRNLNSPWFNWMIPFRLKRPGRGGAGPA